MGKASNSYCQEARPWWCLLVVFLILGLLLPAAPVEAGDDLDELQERQESLEESMEQEEEELEEYRTEEEKIKEEIEELDEEINQIKAEIEELNQEIEAKEANIAEKEEELAEAEANLQEQEELLGDRLRAMQERGSATYLEVLFTSTSFGEFLTRFYDLQVIAQHDRELMEEIEENRDRIVLVKEELEAEKMELQGLRREAASQEEELDRQLASREDQARELEQAIQDKEAAIQEMEEQAQELEQKINRLIAEEGGDYDGGELLWPVVGVAPGQNITSGFGYRTHPIFGGQRWHGGIDIGTGGRQVPILAAESGTVSIAAYCGGYGNYVMITHGGGVATLYAHLSSMHVSEGESVSRGDEIGTAGTTGASTGIHLHFEVHDKERPPVRDYQPHDYRQDPFDYLE